MSITFLIANVMNPEQPKKLQDCEFLVDDEVVKKPIGNACFEY